MWEKAIHFSGLVIITLLLLACSMERKSGNDKSEIPFIDSTKIVVDTLINSYRFVILNSDSVTYFNNKYYYENEPYCSSSELHHLRDSLLQFHLITGKLAPAILKPPMIYIIKNERQIDSIKSVWQNNFSFNEMVYYLVDYNTTKNYLVFNGYEFEGSECLLYDYDREKKINLWNFPYPSNNYKYFTCLSADLAAGFDPNGIELYEFGKDGIVSLIKYETSLWAPESPKWETDNSFYFIGKDQIKDTKKYLKIIFYRI
jgi:hypothetical protein